MRLHGGVFFSLLIAPPLAASGALPAVPSTASPGETARVTAVDESCPTFSWSAAAGSTGYELAVYRLGADGEAADPVLRETLAGAISSWTPALERCLERGARYAWTVRALGEEMPSDWSVPALFEVIRAPSGAELEEALEVVREYLRSADASAARAEARPEAATGAGPEPPGPVSAPFQILGSIGTITVAGEVRTLGPNAQPRLWGTGRPGGVIYGQIGGYCSNAGIRFGLSQAMVDWGSAAQACPAGSWVCTSAERGSSSCVTLRRGIHSVSYMGCDGIIVSPATPNHFGWLADNTGTHYPMARSESGGGAPTPPEACKGFAVWCCFE